MSKSGSQPIAATEGLNMSAVPSYRLGWRFTKLVLVVIGGIGLTLADGFFRAFGISPWAKGFDPTRWWHRRLLWATAVRLEVTGRLEPGCLVVANHVSWLDIPVLGSLAPSEFLAKSEIRDWPLVGWLAAQAGTLFIRRGGHHTEELVEEIARRVQARRRSVVVFPEGTTTDGTYVRRFFARLFAVAKAPGVQVQPVALRYGTNACPDPVAPWIGDDTLVGHARKVLAHPDLVVRVHILPPIDGANLHRKTIAERARAAIVAALDADHGPEFDKTG